MQVTLAELKSLQSLFGAREDALRTGILLQNKRYEVNTVGTAAACGEALPYGLFQFRYIGIMLMALIPLCMVVR